MIQSIEGSSCVYCVHLYLSIQHVQYSIQAPTSSLSQANKHKILEHFYMGVYIYSQRTNLIIYSRFADRIQRGVLI